MTDKVYIVQLQRRWNDSKTDLIPKFDLEPAKMYGELVFLLSPTAGPFNSQSIITELWDKLKDYTPNDYLLLIGNPCLIGWVVAIAAQITGGNVRLLQWNGKEKGYLQIVCDLSKP